MSQNLLLRDAILEILNKTAGTSEDCSVGHNSNYLTFICGGTTPHNNYYKNLDQKAVEAESLDLCQSRP